MTVNVYKMAIFNDVYYINTSLLRNTVNPSVFRGYQPLVSRRLASSTSNTTVLGQTDLSEKGQKKLA